MDALGLLTYRALLRKLDLSCLTAGPLISSVNCHRLCRRGFYRHIPLLKSSRFMTISINSLGDNLRSLWGWWKDHLRAVVWRSNTLSHPHLYTHTHSSLVCAVWLTPFPLSISRSEMLPLLNDGNDSDSPRHQGREDAECWMSLQMMGVLVQVNLYLQLNHLTEQVSLLDLYLSSWVTVSSK